MTMASEAAAAAGERDWANLPGDLVSSIATKLPLADLIRLGSVCKPWNSSARAKVCLEKKPYLLLPPPAAGSAAPLLLSISSDHNTCSPLHPQPPSSSLRPAEELLRGKWCVGSQFGWLAVIDELSNPSLVNPFTGSQIHLPPISTLPFVKPLHNNPDGSISEYLYARPLLSKLTFAPYSLARFRCVVAIKKMVFSTNPAGGNFSALAIFDRLGYLLYTSAGYDRWIFLEFLGDAIGYVADDIIYRDGKFLFLNRREGKVNAIDVDLKFTGNGSPRPCLEATAVGKGLGSWYHSRHLVEHCDGTLLQLCRRVNFVKVPISNRKFLKTECVEVYQLDPELGEWVPMVSLGDHSLFVGTAHCLSLSMRDGTRGYKPNCVYFTDCFRYIFAEDVMKAGIRDVGVYNIGDHSIKTIYPSDNCPVLWPLPIWIIPSGQ